VHIAHRQFNELGYAAEREGGLKQLCHGLFLDLPFPRYAPAMFSVVNQAFVFPTLEVVD
jgi:hypothetical protein